MSIASSIQRSSERVLSSVWSDIVSLVDSTDADTVTRGRVRINKPTKVQMLNSEIQYQNGIGAVAVFPKHEWTTAPESGQIIVVEATGAKHRIGQVDDLGYGWECLCETVTT
jgi:hypothetical protein